MLTLVEFSVQQLFGQLNIQHPKNMPSQPDLNFQLENVNTEEPILPPDMEESVETAQVE